MIMSTDALIRSSVRPVLATSSCAGNRAGPEPINAAARYPAESALRLGIAILRKGISFGAHLPTAVALSHPAD